MICARSWVKDETSREPNTILADVDSVFLAMVVEDETLYCIWDGVMGAGKLLECCYAAAGGLLSEICY
ncbi:hypothetical protein LINPERPRIM_LOCUS14850 [Linum perenne]